MELDVAGPQWVRIRVEGTLSATVNPAYAARQCETPYQLNCYRVPFTPFVGQPIGPYGVPDPSSNALFYPYSHAFVVEGYRGFRETSTEFNFFPAGESATEALVWVPQGGRLLNFSRTGSRHSFTPCWECGPIYAYLLSGQQTVSVRAAEPPLEVESGAPDTAGVVRFEAKAVAGFDQDYLVQAITWHYVAGDTAALPNWNGNRYLAEGWYAKSRSFADSVRGCTGQQTCEIRPPAGGGRMYARFTLLTPDDYRFITAESVVASEVVGICRAPTGGLGNGGLRASAAGTGAGCGEPELVLECKGEVVQADGSVVQEVNRVTRGRTLRCKAKKEPTGAPGEIELTGWSFEGSARRDRPTSGEWDGVMVQGGSIEVEGRIGTGERKTSTAQILVLSRDWSSAVEFPEQAPERRSSVLKYPPIDSIGDIGKEGVWGQHNYTVDLTGRFAVGTGPNANWWYFREPPSIKDLEIRINPGLFPGDPFWEAQRGGRFCRESHMRQARAFVVEHEKGHHDVAWGFWNGPGADLYESSTAHYEGADIAELQSLLDSRPLAVLKQAQDKYHADGGRGGPLALPCTLNTIQTRNGHR